MTKTGYTIDLTEISSTVDMLRQKYDKGNQNISLFRSKNKFKDSFPVKQIDIKESGI